MHDTPQQAEWPSCAEKWQTNPAGFLLGDWCPACRHVVGVHSRERGCAACKVEDLADELRQRLEGAQ